MAQNLETDSAGGLIRFAVAAGSAYFEAMPSKPIELPPKVAKTFVKHMRAYYAEPNAITHGLLARLSTHLNL